MTLFQSAILSLWSINRVLQTTGMISRTTDDAKGSDYVAGVMGHLQ